MKDGSGVPTAGHGLFNEVLAQSGKDTDGTNNNKACGPTVPHDFVVVKAGTQNTGTMFADPTNQYTYGDNNDAMYPLSGAEFAIYNADPNTDASATVVKTLTQASATDGYYWSVDDLNIDTPYWLVETKAPAGPARADGSGTTVELASDLNNTSQWAKGAIQAFSSELNISSVEQGFIINGTNKATLVVKDTEVGELPKAGSTGIFPYIGVATALMSGAMVMTVVTTKRRKAYA